MKNYRPKPTSEAWIFWCLMQLLIQQSVQYWTALKRYGIRFLTSMSNAHSCWWRSLYRFLNAANHLPLLLYPRSLDISLFPWVLIKNALTYTFLCLLNVKILMSTFFQLLGVYSISKTALLGLIKGTANHLVHDGIRINGIAPGVIKTKFAKVVFFYNYFKTVQSCQGHIKGISHKLRK